MGYFWDTGAAYNPGKAEAPEDDNSASAAASAAASASSASAAPAPPPMPHSPTAAIVAAAFCDGERPALRPAPSPRPAVPAAPVKDEAQVIFAALLKGAFPPLKHVETRVTHMPVVHATSGSPTRDARRQMRSVASAFAAAGGVPELKHVPHTRVTHAPVVADEPVSTAAAAAAEGSRSPRTMARREARLISRAFAGGASPQLNHVRTRVSHAPVVHTTSGSAAREARRQMRIVARAMTAPGGMPELKHVPHTRVSYAPIDASASASASAAAAAGAAPRRRVPSATAKGMAYQEALLIEQAFAGGRVPQLNHVRTRVNHSPVVHATSGSPTRDARRQMRSVAEAFAAAGGVPELKHVPHTRVTHAPVVFSKSASPSSAPLCGAGSASAAAAAAAAGAEHDSRHYREAHIIAAAFAGGRKPQLKSVQTRETTEVVVRPATVERTRARREADLIRAAFAGGNAPQLNHVRTRVGRRPVNAGSVAASREARLIEKAFASGCPPQLNHVRTRVSYAPVTTTGTNAGAGAA